jgi:hypothetical protein
MRSEFINNVMLKHQQVYLILVNKFKCNLTEFFTNSKHAMILIDQDIVTKKKSCVFVTKKNLVFFWSQHLITHKLI